MARGDGLARQFELWMLLDQERELSVEDAARRLGCTRRTIYRYLEVLQRMNMPLYQEQHGKRVRWRLVDGYHRKLSVQLSLHEVMSLVAAEHLLSGMKGTVFSRAAQSGVTKLKYALAPELRARLEAMTRTFAASAGPGRNLSPQRRDLDLILDATERDEVVELRYRKLGARKSETYTIEPHHLHVHGSSVYIVAWARERAAARIFLLDRVESVRRLGGRFERRSDLLPGAFSQGAFGLWEGADEQVRLRFTDTAARIVGEQHFHASQQLEPCPDGSLVLTMRLPLSPAFVAWVRGFGARVKIEAPTRLRRLVRPTLSLTSSST